MLNKTTLALIGLAMMLMGCELTGADKSDINEKCQYLRGELATVSYEEAIQNVKIQGIEKKLVTGNTMLHVAAFCFDSEFVRELIKAGAKTNPRNDAGWSPLHAAAFNTNDPNVISVLIEGGANVNARTGGSDTPLHLAAINNCNPDVVVALIDGGADGGAFNKENPRAKANAIVDGDDSTPFNLLSTCLENTEAYWVLKDAAHYNNR